MVRLSPALAACLLAAAVTPAVAQTGGYSGPLPIVTEAAGTVPTKQTLFLEMRRDGTLVHGDEEITYGTLRKSLVAFAGKYRDGVASLGQLHLRMHPELPFEALYRVMDLCSEREVFLYRIFLGVRAAANGPERAVPLFLPADSRGFAGKGNIRIELSYARPPVDDQLLERRISQAAGRLGGTATHRPTVILAPESNTTIASLVRVVHAARRHGFDDFGCRRPPSPAYPAWDKGERDFVKLVASQRPRPGSEPGVSFSAERGDTAIAAAEVEEEIEEVMVEEVAAEKAKTERIEKEKIEKEKVETEKETPRPVLGPGVADTYAPRSGSHKARNSPAESAVRTALQWLAEHQDEDGKWDADGFMKHDRKGPPTDGPGNPVHDVGVTGLALLAFLGHGNTLRAGPYQESVKRGVKWLREQQDKKGLFGTQASHDFIYDHAIAALAMCEAYGLSNYKVLKQPAQRGIDYLESHRNPYAVWRYQPRDNDNDLSVTSWCVLAYKAAQDFGLQVNGNALRIAAAFLDEVTDPATGRAGYTKRGELSSRHPGDHGRRFPVAKCEALTAAGLFTRFMLGQNPKRKPVMRRAADTILAKPPQWRKDGSIDLYYWYYGSHAMYQMGGNHWQAWRRAMQKALVENQRRDGSFGGSWDPVSVWSEDGGRIYATALATLTLESEVRYAQLIR